MDAVSPRLLKVIRVLFITAGGMLIAFAFFADVLGYGYTGSFGIGQLFLVVAGGIVFLVGILGTRFFRIYRDFAVIFLNTLLLIIMLEFGAIIIGRINFRDQQAGIENLSYYSAQDWSKVYWEEAGDAQGVRYRPYVVWRHAPFEGKTVNFNPDGVRLTPGVDCQPGAEKVFTFGGSTMLGWGSPDWGTIAAYLQISLEEQSDWPVCVINFGEDGYVSSQSLVALVLQLQSGNIPDVVIFYDGVNEVIAAYESGEPVAHVTLGEIKAKFEEQENPFVKIVRSTRLYAFARRSIDAIELKNQGNNQESLVHRGITINPSQLAEEMTKAYIGNYRIVGALAEEYGFDFFFFLQPHPAVGEKSLTEEEQAIINRMDPNLARLAKAFYDDVAFEGLELERFGDLTDLFLGHSEQIWIDVVGHTTPDGNRLIAEAIFEVIRPHFLE